MLVGTAWCISFRHRACAGSVWTVVWGWPGGLLQCNEGAQQGAACLGGVLSVWMLWPHPRVVGPRLVVYGSLRCVGLVKGCGGCTGLCLVAWVLMGTQVTGVAHPDDCCWEHLSRRLPAL
ncbi:hypothetical protein CRENBAI_013000 [Crenichthys baileyi]|uniref:Uncharacterized protein n=1 Tax=Crenichthys baileyi TaxID=28760 RepID=A0AAV9SE70_9TELE